MKNLIFAFIVMLPLFGNAQGYLGYTLTEIKTFCSVKEFTVKYKDDEVKNDVFETYNDNVQLESRTNYKNDKLDGLCEMWYPTGQLWSRVNYKNDERNGLREMWYDNGQMMTRATY